MEVGIELWCPTVASNYGHHPATLAVFQRQLAACLSLLRHVLGAGRGRGSKILTKDYERPAGRMLLSNILFDDLEKTICLLM